MGLKLDPKNHNYMGLKLDPKNHIWDSTQWDRESPGNIFQLLNAFKRSKLARCLDTLSVRETITFSKKARLSYNLL